MHYEFEKSSGKIAATGKAIRANKGYSFWLKFIRIFKLRALDSPYTRMHTSSKLS